MNNQIEEFTGNILSNQEVFDFVTRKIIEQGHAAVDKKGYPTWHETDTCRCAVGWLVTVDEYKNLSKNGTTCFFIVRDKKKTSHEDNTSMYVVIKLQQLHDRSNMISRAGKGEFISLFKTGAREIANEFKLLFKSA